MAKNAVTRTGESRFICTDGAAATHSIWKDKINLDEREKGRKLQNFAF